MFVIRRLALLLAVLLCLEAIVFAQPSNQMAERALGPQWKLVSRASGLIFAGTMLSVDAQAPTIDAPLPVVELKFRVEQAIAGTKIGEIVTIREWAGAWDTHRHMHPGQHFLLFFYPPSTLGLTSLVGGSLGQIELDATGHVIASPPSSQNPGPPRSAPTHSTSASPIHLRQLQRAIRGAREE